jgi:hypothetical protein
MRALNLNPQVAMKNALSSVNDCINKRNVYVYLSNIPAIATENLLVLLFSLCSQYVSAPTGHLQVKYNYITYILRFHLKMASRGRNML